MVSLKNIEIFNLRLLFSCFCLFLEIPRLKSCGLIRTNMEENIKRSWSSSCHCQPTRTSISYDSIQYPLRLGICMRDSNILSMSMRRNLIMWYFFAGVCGQLWWTVGFVLRIWSTSVQYTIGLQFSFAVKRKIISLPISVVKTLQKRIISTHH
jgi:hypothetical protein